MRDGRENHARFATGLRFEETRGQARFPDGKAREIAPQKTAFASEDVFLLDQDAIEASGGPIGSPNAAVHVESQLGIDGFEGPAAIMQKIGQAVGLEIEQLRKSLPGALF